MLTGKAGRTVARRADSPESSSRARRRRVRLEVVSSPARRSTFSTALSSPAEHASPSKPLALPRSRARRTRGASTQSELRSRAVLRAPSSTANADGSLATVGRRHSPRSDNDPCWSSAWRPRQASARCARRAGSAAADRHRRVNCFRGRNGGWGVAGHGGLGGGPLLRPRPVVGRYLRLFVHYVRSNGGCHGGARYFAGNVVECTLAPVTCRVVSETSVFGQGSAAARPLSEAIRGSRAGCRARPVR